MKTTLQWLKTLKEPVRTQAINNHKKYKASLTKEKAACYLKKDVCSLAEAIAGAFNWSPTPEGVTYWSNRKGEADRIEETI